MSSDHIQPIRELRYWQSINFTDNICIALVPRMTKSHFSTFSLAVFGCAFKRFEASKEHLGRSGRVVKCCLSERKQTKTRRSQVHVPPPGQGNLLKRAAPFFEVGPGCLVSNTNQTLRGKKHFTYSVKRTEHSNGKIQSLVCSARNL